MLSLVLVIGLLIYSISMLVGLIVLVHGDLKYGYRFPEEYDC